MRAALHLFVGLALCVQVVPSQAVTVEEMLQLVLGWYRPYAPQELFALLKGQFSFPTATPTETVAGLTPTPSETLAPTPTNTQGQQQNPYRGTWNMLVQGTALGIAAGGPIAVCPTTGQALAPAVLMGANVTLAQTRWEGTVGQAGMVTNGKIYTVTGGGGQIGTWTGTFTPTTEPFGNFSGNWSISGTGSSTCTATRISTEVTLQGVCP
ncbi:MAG: hypothetical protein GHCLOJNM_02204 [bacterium]|nr:hypothetical protein [bacterium]